MSMVKFKFALPAVLFVGLVAIFALGLRLDPTEVPSTFIDKPAPAFDLPQLFDPSLRIRHTDLMGQVSLLNVWASWCVGCAREHALLIEIDSQYRVPIYGLNWKDDPNDAINWLGRLGNPYTAIAVDYDNVTGIDYGVYGAPETFLLDADGVIRYKHIGPLNREIWERDILPLVRRLKEENA